MVTLQGVIPSLHRPLVGDKDDLGPSNTFPNEPLGICTMIVHLALQGILIDQRGDPVSMYGIPLVLSLECEGQLRFTFPCLFYPAVQLAGLGSELEGPVDPALGQDLEADMGVPCQVHVCPVMVREGGYVVFAIGFFVGHWVFTGIIGDISCKVENFRVTYLGNSGVSFTPNHLIGLASPLIEV
jgi:hypothetical protein